MTFRQLLLFLFILFGISPSCKGQKNVPYYKVKLLQYEDYTMKFDKVVDYLNKYSSDPESICTRLITDLVVFENDISSEMEENKTLTPYQIDTLESMRIQVKALKNFMDCIAWCSEYPVIQVSELYMATDLLRYQTMVVDSSGCSKTIECKKQDYHYYFLINTDRRTRGIRYSYTTFNGSNDSGFRELKQNEGAAIFGVFNDFSSDWIYRQNVLCN